MFQRWPKIHFRLEFELSELGNVYESFAWYLFKNMRWSYRSFEACDFKKPEGAIAEIQLHFQWSPYDIGDAGVV